MNDEATFGWKQTCLLARISPRQLQWWDESRLVVPLRQGHTRVYQSQRVLEVAVIAELRRKGFALQGIRRFLRPLRIEMARRLEEYSELYLVTDGKRVWFLGSAKAAVDFMTDLKRGVALVSVSDKAERINRLTIKRKAYRRS